MDFVSFPKIPRLRRSVVITEKIDGTNAQIVIGKIGDTAGHDVVAHDTSLGLEMRVGSRSRWISPGKETDNFGFAAWCVANATELFKLGEGQHFGEWFGLGIQCGYGLDHKRFALFNTARWGAHNPNTPACCHVVPVITILDEIDDVQEATDLLRKNGSIAVPGFMKPEGVVVYHSASRSLFKVLLENDDVSKGQL